MRKHFEDIESKLEVFTKRHDHVIEKKVFAWLCVVPFLLVLGAMCLAAAGIFRDLDQSEWVWIASIGWAFLAVMAAVFLGRREFRNWEKETKSSDGKNDERSTGR